VTEYYCDNDIVACVTIKVHLNSFVTKMDEA